MEECVVISANDILFILDMNKVRGKRLRIYDVSFMECTSYEHIKLDT